ncbi:DELLA protein RGL1 [Selaginella moellendorffii]|nr:DELLA protein RGL1 [Selaginella moellendorffii]|eukprot:XP_002983047.2 DELLA protein RGL1 [Selaginella moellendorffii]
MFHHPFQEDHIPSHEFILQPEELLMDMELCPSKKELEALFVYGGEPDSVLDLGPYISPLNSPSSEASSTIFNTHGFSDEPWEYETIEDMNFDLDLLSPTSTTSSSDISLQDPADDDTCDDHLNMLEDLLLDDDDHDGHTRQELEVEQQQNHHVDQGSKLDAPREEEEEEGIEEVERAGEKQDEEKRGLEIVHLLLACVENIQGGDMATSKLILDHLAASSRDHPPHLSSPIERVSTHISKALSERITKTSIFDATTSDDLAFARRAFYQHFPFLKFAHFTANQAILESLRGCSQLHIVDLDIDQGMQWPSLIQALSQIENAPPLRITGVGSSFAELQSTGRRLTEFATSIGYHKLDYHPVRLDSPDQLDPSAFSLGDDDDQDVGLAVNCSMFLHRLLGNHPALERTLCMIRAWNPRIVTVSEMEANHNTPSFVDRFVEALHFYSAVFDCLESALARTDPDRIYIEGAMFAGEIRSILACEGADRIVRHARSESWRDFMRWSGFKDVGLSDHSLYQAHVFLTLYSQAYRLTREEQALILGWHDTPVVSISTWSC